MSPPHPSSTRGGSAAERTGAARFTVIIPARYGSTRLAGKPLRRLAGQTMIERVHGQAVQAGARAVVVATDDERIEAEVRRFGGRAVMTSPAHATGTDRVSEAVRALGLEPDEIVVNLQGDEPLFDPALLRLVATALDHHPAAAIATLAAPLGSVEDLYDPSVVKVVLDATGHALYFTRAPVPWARDEWPRLPALASRLPEAGVFLRHLGVYAYRASTLQRFCAEAPCALERAESLEQVRALWLGWKIHVSGVDAAPPAGVDTEDDLRRVEAWLAARPLAARDTAEPSPTSKPGS